jgi:hypothetical protein
VHLLLLGLSYLGIDTFLVISDTSHIIIFVFFIFFLCFIYFLFVMINFLIVLTVFSAVASSFRTGSVLTRGWKVEKDDRGEYGGQGLGEGKEGVVVPGMEIL